MISPRIPKLVVNPIRSAITHRHLLKEFIFRDIRGRFAGSVGGIFWALINPLVTIAIFLFIFSSVLRIHVSPAETGTDRFFIYFLSGFFPWLFFSESLTRSVGILVENANLITKVVFPVELLPTGSVISSFFINSVGFAFYLLILVSQGYCHPTWLFLPMLILLQFFFCWGLANLLSGICVFIRDIREILGLALMVWFYATPIIFPLSMVPANFDFLIKINPLAIYIQCYRDILLTHQMNLAIWFQCFANGAFFYCLGAWFFMKARPAFGDVL